ncbi:hypothetical protein AeMF1_004955 [Aphanomyces euteiches]|nr:hypothetical protein AeMF1_004955 [Aphanomyces euteiches]KAH9186037.1 hypothetical protein AeNC1_011983 [Aphanomyces euteiches]
MPGEVQLMHHLTPPMTSNHVTIVFNDHPSTSPDRHDDSQSRSLVHRIRHSKVCRGKARTCSPPSVVPPTTTTVKTSSSLSSTKQLRPTPTTVEDGRRTDDNELTSIAAGPEKTLVHSVIVETIRARQRTSRLRVAQINELLSPADGLETPETLDVEHNITVEPVVSPCSAVAYSRTLRAMWNSKESSSPSRTSAPPSLDISHNALSTAKGDVDVSQLVAELEVIKTILVREQLLQRMTRLNDTVNAIAAELSAKQQPPKPVRRKSLGRLQLNADDNNPVEDKPLPTQRAKEDAVDIAKLELRVAAAIKELGTTVGDFRKATVDVVHAIQRWRALFHVNQHTNRPPMHHRPFIFEGANYMEKMAHDVNGWFDGIALQVLLGTSVVPHPLLLPKDSADALQRLLGLPPLQSSTFLTDKAPAATAHSSKLTDQLVKLCNLPSPPSNMDEDLEIQTATAVIMSECQPPVDPTPSGPVYDPFDTIRQFPTVGDVFEAVLSENHEAIAHKRHALLRRQQDTARANVCLAHMATSRSLHVNTTKLEAFLETRQSAERAFVTTETKGRGTVLVRRKPKRTRHPTHVSVVKIQAQYRQHKFRVAVLVALRAFSLQIHSAATDIQRVYRGHRAKSTVGYVQGQLFAQERFYYFKARVIQRSYRDWRHAKRVAVPAATAPVVQLVDVPKGPSQTELYREAGRRRRMERDLLAAQHRAEMAKLLAAQVAGCRAIQRCFRRCNQRKATKLLRVAKRVAKESKAATRIQCFVRGCLAKTHARRLRQKLSMDTINYSSTLIQAVYRGHCVRQRLSIIGSMEAKTSSHLPAVVLKPTVVKTQPVGPRRPRRRSVVTVPKPLQSPRDKLPSINRRQQSSRTVWEELKLKEPRIGENL